MTTKRTAETNFERGLLAFSAWSLCALVACVFVFVSWLQLTKTPPGLTPLEGTLHGASFDEYGLELQLTGSPVRFAVLHPPDGKALRKLYETQVTGPEGGPAALRVRRAPTPARWTTGRGGSLP
jgi:hypothetical protein